MTPEELLVRAGDQLGVRRVFGEPIERDGVVVIPVAVALGGGGGGVGPTDQGHGGGFAGSVRGIGVYTLREGKVRFMPAVDVVALTTVVLLLARPLLKALARRRP